MPAPFIIPFNNQPVNTGVTAASYTVPAGKYARVIVSIGLTATFSNGGSLTNIGSTTSGSTNYGVNTGHFNDKIELWLKAGDVLAFTTSLASGTISTVAGATIGGQFEARSASSQTSSTITLNASALATFYATASVYHHQTFPAAAGTLVAATIGTFAGTATVVTHFEEFNVIS
jgi:hypothetical protein